MLNNEENIYKETFSENNFYEIWKWNEKNSGGGYQSRNIVGQNGWPMRKIFHFKLSRTARKTKYL